MRSNFPGPGGTGGMDTTSPPVHALVRLDGFALPTYVSHGAEGQGAAAAARAGRVLDWHARLFPHRPAPVLFVVGPADWGTVALVPQYGLPHAEFDRVVIGTQPAAFWQHYLDVITPRLASAAVGRLREVYGEPPDLGGRFADLVLVHELAHLYHAFAEAADATDFPRLWLAELFANVGLYGYLAEVEPEHLAELVTVCELSALAGPDPWPVRELDRMDDGLADEPLNYIWFELLLVLIAQRIWTTRGPSGYVQLHQTLRQNDLTDEDIIERLTRIHPSVGAMTRRWPLVFAPQSPG